MTDPRELLTLNIGAAGLDRATRIWQWLGGYQPEVLVLTETSPGPGTRFIVDNLTHHGYRVAREEHPQDRGVLVASRCDCDRISTLLATPLPHRIAALRVEGIVLMGVYVPSRDRSPVKVARKREFTEALLRTLGSVPSRDRIVLVGDYNVVARDHAPKLAGLFDWEYDFHDQLDRLGFTAAHCDMAAQPHSWIGRTGIGYLYDYVHAGRAVEAFDCRYLHETREQGLSDHAAVSVRVVARPNGDSRASS